MTAIDRDGVIVILTGLASETADVEGTADRILALDTPDPRLARIRALCDDAGYAGLPSNLVAQIRGILDAVDAEASR